MLKNALLVSLMIFASFRVTAQKSWEAGLLVGANGYMGDINPKKFYQLNSMAYGATAKRNFDGYWSAKLFFMQGNIKADDLEYNNPFQQNRKLSFFSAITEASLQVEFNFFNYVAGLSRTRISPYLFTGIGAVKFNPKAKIGGSTYILNPLQTEGQTNPYKTTAISVPYGMGVKYNVMGNWSLVAELGYRTAFTDYLDDVSGNYKNPLPPGVTQFDPSGMAIAGTKRGDGRKRDTYMLAGLSLTYTFVSEKCPTAR